MQLLHGAGPVQGGVRVQRDEGTDPGADGVGTLQRVADQLDGRDIPAAHRGRHLQRRQLVQLGHSHPAFLKRIHSSPHEPAISARASGYPQTQLSSGMCLKFIP